MKIPAANLGRSRGHRESDAICNPTSPEPQSARKLQSERILASLTTLTPR
jgi:hypothetical protein